MARNRLRRVLVPFHHPSGTGLSTNYSYYGNSIGDGTGDEDQRLEEIKNMSGNGGTQLSKFDYTYNRVGTIATWTQQADTSTAVVNTLTYDNADQLINAAQSGGGSASNAYHYDPAGNRLAEVTGSGTTAGQFNALNQLTGLSSSTTATTVSGHTSATTTNVTIDAIPATISSSTNFSATVPLPSGTNVVTIVAQPSATGTATTTQRVQIVTTGTAASSLSYDANGNVITDEHGNTYAWDALNRLTSIVYNDTSNPAYGTHTEFAYDGLSRRTQIIERAGTTIGSGTVSSTKNYLWIGQEIAEERDASNAVNKRFFPQGEQQSGTDYYYTRDHLGSVRELCSSTGTITSRMAYDPYGRTTTVSGTILPTKQYAGCYQHQTSGLALTKYRAYDAITGRWLSRDPLAENGGLNLYVYVGDEPIEEIDPLGLANGSKPRKVEPDANQYEQNLDNIDPGTLYSAIGWLCANKAREVAPQLVPEGREGGAQDAFRHCFWSCCMAKWIGAAAAKTIGDNHEKRNMKYHEESPDDFRQDTSNNANGRGAANDNCSCADACMKKLKNGGLTGLNGQPQKYP